MNKRKHWENVYQTKGRDQVSWFREHLDTSLRMIANRNFGKAAAIINVGGVNSTLVDDLLERGFVVVSVLDISGKAITGSKRRLGNQASKVNGYADDITAAQLPDDLFDVWHDRAVFGQRKSKARIAEFTFTRTPTWILTWVSKSPSRSSAPRPRSADSRSETLSYFTRGF